MAIRLSLAVAAIIAVLTLAPIPSGPAPVLGVDKLEHLLAFGALAVPLSWRVPRLWGVVALAVIAYGGAIEIVQPLAGRNAEWGDLAADAVGAVAAAWCASRLGIARARARARSQGR